MASNVTRMPQQQITDPSGNWWWNGSQWVCGCDDGSSNPPIVQVPPCPPFFPPPITQPPWYPGANGGVSFGTTAPPNPIRGSFWWDGKVLWMFDGAAWVNTATGVTQGGSGGGSNASGAGTVIISTTPPGNPQNGAQWWDGTVLRVWDGTQWQIVGPGTSVGPVPTTTEVFRITQTTNSTVATNSWQIAPFTATPVVSQQITMDAISKKITPNRAGVYLWFVRTYLGSGPTGAAGVTLARNDPGTVTNNTELTALNWFAGAPGGVAGEWLSAGGVSIMNGTTDYMRLWLWSGDGQMYGFNFPNIEGYLLP